MWNLSVPVSALVITKDLLTKADYHDINVCMESIVPWSALAGTSVARGPKAGELKLKISWLAVLKILLESFEITANCSCSFS